MKFSKVVLIGTATLATAQPHNHAHRHPARNGSPVQGRDVAVTEIVAGPVVTVFEMHGQVLDAAEVEAGLAAGKYVIVGGVISSVESTTSTSAIATSSSATAAVEAAVLYQESSVKTTSTSSTVPTTSSTTSTTSIAPTTTSSTVASTTSSASAVSTSSSSSAGIDTDFPSGTIKCSEFPSAYGAVALSYLGLNGWSGIQYTPDYTTDATDISTINTGVDGDDCTENSFCSYACPAGYQKTQWPSAQGATGQSIGGLWCNTDGYLEISNSDYSTICAEGTGNVYVVNSLDEDVPICRTDYPGTESETIPTMVTSGGSNIALTNPASASYYKTWQGLSTTAQYYINPAGSTEAEACVWGSSGTNLGNWAPVNLGVGKATTDITYLSLFQNSPTNDDGVLDYTIEITGDSLSGTCKYISGTYYSDGVESSTGCTVATTGDAYIKIYSS
jgi:hypothetical protein